jgi:hypothetical protein
VAIGIIRPETAILVRRPYIAILRIVNPLAIGSKILVKIVVRNVGVVLGINFYGRKSKCEKQDKRQNT